jgi:hypothetical protein
LVLFLQKKNKNLLFLKKKKQKDFYASQLHAALLAWAFPLGVNPAH